MRKATPKKIDREGGLRRLEKIEAAPELKPKRPNGGHRFIPHEGRFFPCCMIMAAVRHHMERTVFHRRREQFDVRRHGLAGMRGSEAFAGFIATPNGPSKTYRVCREECASAGTTNRSIGLDGARPSTGAGAATADPALDRGAGRQAEFSIDASDCIHNAARASVPGRAGRKQSSMERFGGRVGWST